MGLSPACTLRSDREPAVSHKVLAYPFQGNHKPVISIFWTRPVELEDSLGRRAPGAGVFLLMTHFALILMGDPDGWLGRSRTDLSHSIVRPRCLNVG